MEDINHLQVNSRGLFMLLPMIKELNNFSICPNIFCPSFLRIEYSILPFVWNIFLDSCTFLFDVSTLDLGCYSLSVRVSVAPNTGIRLANGRKACSCSMSAPRIMFSNKI